jgi:hypothetical protein
VAAVAAPLARPGVRLVTLTGPGGVGKTRVALAVAAAAEAGEAGFAAVDVVSLAAVADPALVLPTIARGLGVREAEGGGGTAGATAWAAGLSGRPGVLSRFIARWVASGVVLGAGGRRVRTRGGGRGQVSGSTQRARQAGGSHGSPQ